MKAKELMIGDWLKHANGKYYRVTRIDGLGDYDSIHYACGFPHLWEYNNKFEPIPITSEILENNGFKRYSGGIGDKLAEYIIYDDVIWWNGNIYIYNENKVLYDDIDVHYVHQLQHFLYFVGVDKKIEL